MKAGAEAIPIKDQPTWNLTLQLRNQRGNDHVRMRSEKKEEAIQAPEGKTRKTTQAKSEVHEKKSTAYVANVTKIEEYAPQTRLRKFCRDGKLGFI